MSPGRLRVPVPWQGRPRTLRTTLVASVIALFLVVSAASGALTVFALRGTLTSQLDRDLAQAAERIDGIEDGREPEAHDRGHLPGPQPGGGNAVLRVVLIGDSVLLNTAVNTSNEVDSLDAAQLDRLRDAEVGASPETVDLGGDIGRYRLVAQPLESAATAITGVPTAGLEATVARAATLVSVGTLLGLVAVAAGSLWLVRRALAPLDRVAGTARRVSALKLDAGAVALPERVPAADTDPRTEVGQVGAALNAMLDNVDQALRARHDSEQRVRRFVADASHELRTPLASIRGYAELSRREPEPVPGPVRHALTRVESEALRMQGLVEDLLLLARLDEGRPLAAEPVDLTLLTMDAVSDARAASPDHHWSLDLPDEPMYVTGDRARLHQVLANLLANARTHTPAGSHVKVGLRHTGSGVQWSVTDDGPGIPDALQPEVFQRFSRGDDARSRAAGSTGLGLSIVQAVVRAHGGTVAVDSQPGRTVFEVDLPAA